VVAFTATRVYLPENKKRTDDIKKELQGAYDRLTISGNVWPCSAGGDGREHGRIRQETET